MGKLVYKLAIIVGGLVLLQASTALAEEKVNLGVSIPAATHGWTGGVVFWANQAKKELEQANPGLKITVKRPGVPPNKETSCRTFSQPPRSILWSSSRLSLPR
jgi:ribose transport system substrate-binding protein